MHLKVTCSGGAQTSWLHLKTKLLLSMKLAAVIMFTACLQISARGHSQSVTLSLKDAPLQKVFKEIKDQTGYLFLYTSTVMEQSHPVTIEVINAPLEEVLHQCFLGQPLTYAIIEKTVVIQPAPPALAVTNASAPPAPVRVHGEIENEKGAFLPGAIIRIKNSSLGAVADDRGEFTLVDVDPNATLIITNIGYETKEIKLHGQQTLQIILKVKSNPLDELQVIAYGTTTAKLATGNITTISAKEIEHAPVSNPLLALEGKVTGLNIIQATGLPGSGLSVKVEGTNSLGNGNDPLYVVDGVPYVSETLPNLGFELNGGGNNGSPGGDGSPLSFINPADIESITVLKDADATAIYGSRAANGAILITTKKGVAGKTSVTVNVQDGWGKVTRFLDVMNTTQYLQMRREAFKNDGITPGPTDYDINGMWDTTRNINWQKVLLGGAAQYKTATLSISGGNENTQYRISGTYHKETAVTSGDFADQKGSAAFNIQGNTPDQKFKFQLSGNYMVDVNRLPTYDLTLNATQLVPDAPPLFNKDGSVNWALDSTGNPTFSDNPMSLMYYKDTRKTNNLISHALLGYQILQGLEIKSSFGYTDMQGNETTIFPLTAINPLYLRYAVRSANYENSDINSWIVEPQITYNRRIAKGRLEALVGATIEQNNSGSQQVQGSGYSSDLSLYDLAAAATLTTGYNSTAFIYKYNAAFGRLNYNWQDRYIIDLTARRDGSSRFGSANEFHNFGAMGLGWIFSGENFVRDHLSFLSFGKLTASYGTTGNDQIGDYKFMTLYSPTIQAIPYQGGTGLMPNGLPNPYLQWEETRKLYLSLKLGFFNDRILFTAGYTNNHSSNQLLFYPLSSIAGFYGVERNLPATVQNTSGEFTVKTTNISTRDFSWTCDINLTIPRNKLVSFPDFANSGYASYLTIGKDINSFRVYHLLGVDPATGQFEFLGADGKPTINPNYSTDNIVQINMDPKFYGGFQNSFTYKGIELDVLLQFVKQNGRTNPFGNLPGYFDGGGSVNQPVWVLKNSWQNPGQTGATQMRFSTTYNGNLLSSAFNGQGSDAGYGDASFIRLRNVSLSWQIPGTIVKRTHLQSCQLYVHAENLLTITKFLGMDPESQNLSSIYMPPLRVITVGLQVGL